ncbi:MAG TPA: hypothetical protein DDW24_01310, partial [Blastocatellia bacterium]|nr:hypothetical protein [Blastocatellia bacterium]
MKRTIYSSFLAFFLLTFGLRIAGQTSDAAIKPSVVNGEVVAVGAASIELKTDAGQITVQLTEKTEYKRVPPTNPSLKAAVPALLSDIGAGDKRSEE